MKICDHCLKQADYLMPTQEVYGKLELCEKCLKEGSAIVSKCHEEHMKQLMPKKIAAFEEWRQSSKKTNMKIIMRRAMEMR